MSQDVADRLRKLMNDRGMKQNMDLVRITGGTSGAVSMWLSGKRDPQGIYLTRISEYFDVSVNWILTGKDGIRGPEFVGAVPYQPRKVPLLSWVQAGAWTDTCCDQLSPYTTEWQETTAKVSDRAFALVVRGDSMTNPTDARSIQDGAKVVVDPEFNHDEINHKIVVAMLEGSTEATIKEFVQDGPNKYLFPLNPRYQPIPVNGNCHIIGIVKQAIIDF